MGINLQESLGSLKVGEPVFSRNLTIFPMSNGGGTSHNLATLSQALDAGTVSVSELEVPTVGEVILDNQGDEPLFVLDGEEIFGAHQTRVTTTASLIEARSRSPVPVACIEEGRWEGGSSFQGSLTSTHPRLRSIICNGVNDSLKESKSFTASQRLVWNEVSRKLTSLKIASATSSFHDLATSLADETDAYAIDPYLLSDSEGMIITSGNRILGMEYASDPDLLAGLIPKLLRGYALDALEYRNTSKPPTGKRLENYLEDIMDLSQSSYPGVDLGQDVRFTGRKHVGRALTRSGSIIQASFFPRV